MIDLHIHVLPGVDDGATDETVARAMLDRARSLGYQRLVATPHLPGPLDAAYLAQVERALALVQAMAPAASIDVGLGFEVALTPDLPARLEAGEPATLAGSRAVLVDLPVAGWPLHVDTTLFALQVAGFRPVLAHPERYASVQQNPGRGRELADRGILLQATISSFVGLFGVPAQRTAEFLLRQGAIHLVATDAHSVGHRFADVERGLARIRTLVGGARMEQLVSAVPHALLVDANLPLSAPIEPLAHSRPSRARRWFFSRV